MRKSRLNFFKSTSMLISVVGIILIASMVIVAGYIGYSYISSGINNQIASGTQYEELTQLKSDYSSLQQKFDDIKSSYYSGSDQDKMATYNNARIELSRADSAIDNAQSALDSGKPSNEVDSRLDFAHEKLNRASDAYNNLT